MKTACYLDKTMINSWLLGNQYAYILIIKKSKRCNMLSNAVLKDLKNESSCSHSTDKAAKTCERPKPGATTGGCAFEGAQRSLFPFADCAHIVHSPATCLNASWETRQTRTSWDGTDFTQMGFCTDINANDLIFGGEKKLKAGIDYVVENYHPKGIFVYSTCVTAMTG